MNNENGRFLQQLQINTHQVDDKEFDVKNAHHQNKMYQR